MSTPSATIHNFAPPEDVVALMHDKLASSGISPEAGAALRYTALTAEETAAKGLWSWLGGRPSIEIPFFKPSAGYEPMMCPFTKTPIRRYRSLRKETGVNAKDIPKYLQPRGMALAAYFPRVINWETALTDVDYRLIITEGEFKAAKACLSGYPTIGVTGVHNWHLKNAKTHLLNELECVDWRAREVIVAFDSDFTTNRQVCLALIELCDELVDRGAKPIVLELPKVAGLDKTGIDDWLVANPSALLENLIEDAAVPLCLARDLWDMNTKYVYVRKPQGVLQIGDNTIMRVRDFPPSMTGFTSMHAMSPAGRVAMKKVPIAVAWLAWQLRSEVHQLVYEPAHTPLQRVTIEEIDSYNLYPGWGAEAKEGDAKPFFDLVDYVFSGAEADAKRWFLQWCAYPIQRPGTKLQTACLLHGAQHGTGKSAIGQALGSVYGDNFSEIKQADLDGGFNAWAEHKQFILVDDITGYGAEQRHLLDVLKKVVTQQRVTINCKYAPSYAVRDTMNFLFTSNRPAAFSLENTDRRFFIHEVRTPPAPQHFYDKFDRWLHSKSGPAALHHALRQVNLRGFNPNARAPRTEAKEAMTTVSRNEMTQWVDDLKNNPESVLQVGAMPIYSELVTPRQLVTAYAASRGINVDRGLVMAMARELGDAGIKKACGGGMVRTSENESYRYYAVKNGAKWEKATANEVRAHLANSQKPGGKKY